MLGVRAHVSPRTQKAEAGESHWVWGQTGLPSEFQDSQVDVERPYLKQTKKNLNSVLCIRDIFKIQ